jgi:eukaryotic-like serine/threonine-protein kinase
MVSGNILHYEILEKLGEGGMGEVYKARDTKLERFVALKFLPSKLIATESDKARFIQEAKAASALNHPNICTIFDIHEADGNLFIVMEYVDGETLRSKKQSFSTKQVIDIGSQAADGLAEAHEKGIVHRDIKPENLMITKNGNVKIMDFGLAKLNSPTEASRLTKAGTTLGTVGYMSPEQVQGQDVDHRSDIFSLGVVLYEMLSGESPFKGVHETAIMYEIVNVDPPPISTVKPGVDPAFEELIMECLEKDRNERCQSARELARNLRKSKRGSTGVKTSRVYDASSFSRRQETGSTVSGFTFAGLRGYVFRNKTAASITVVSMAAFVVMALARFKSHSPAFTDPVQFSFDIPGKSSQILSWGNILQVSPDGKTIVYTDLSGAVSTIMARDINNSTPHLISGTEGGKGPVLVNSNWLSFSNAYNFVGKVPLTGGVPDFSTLDATDGYAWGTDGELVSANSWPSGLTYQSKWNAKGEDLTDIDPSQNEGTHLWPFVLPGNNAAVFTIWSKDGSFDDSKIAVVNLKTKERQDLSFNGVDLQGTFPRFLRTPWGKYLIWSRGGDLYASTFSLSRMEVTGPPIKILDGVSVNAGSGAAAYSVSDADNGTIAYIPGSLDIAKNDLVWVDRKGNEQEALSTSGPYLMPEISKEGHMLVVLSGAAYKIGEVNLKKDEVTPLFKGGDNDIPKITPDGSSFVFVSNFEDGKYNVYLSRLDGIGGVRKIVATEGGYPEISNLSPDGRYILFDQPAGKSKIMIKNIADNQPPKVLLDTDANSASAEFSPDGRFIAYRSDEIAGKFKLFVRPFPINGDRIQVSKGDGIFPQWSFDGLELYYREGDRIMVARIQTKPDLKVISRQVVYSSAPIEPDNSVQPDFAVGPGGRILVLKPAEDLSKPIKVDVIVNWFTELRKTLTEQN